MRRANCFVPLLFLVVSMAGVQALEANTCQVPNDTYPTIQAAVDDPDCGEVVLAAMVYSGSVVIYRPPATGRPLVIRGVSSGETTIVGNVQINGGEIQLNNLTVDVRNTIGGLGSAVAVGGGGQMRGIDLVVLDTAVLFADSFDSGDTRAWSKIAP